MTTRPIFVFQYEGQSFSGGCWDLKDNDKLNIDEGLLNALLKTEKYKHGARSLETIVTRLKDSSANTLLRSNIPSAKQLAIHVDPEDFKKQLIENQKFKTKAADLAPAIHQFYLDLCKSNKWEIAYDMPYNKLPKEIQADNIDAAKRMTDVLSLVGLQVVPKRGDEESAQDSVINCINDNINLLAEEEHNLWANFRRNNGWRYDTERDDVKKKHPSIVPYKQLDNEDIGKDRDAVTNYPAIVKNGEL